jgi:SAM-dependent methyltransferase
VSGKRYDRAYFDRWYRGRGNVKARAELERRVQLAVAVAETVLDRPLRSVLDVGCGEGQWAVVLRRLRPRLRYVGVDASEYAVRRYGRHRGLVLGSFGQLAALRLRRQFDLVVCADVMHYLPAAELDAGLPALATLTRGAAFLETYTTDDRIEGDMRGFQRRPAAYYRRRFRGVGLVPLGLHCWAPADRAHSLAALEQR